MTKFTSLSCGRVSAKNIFAIILSFCLLTTIVVNFWSTLSAVVFELITSAAEGFQIDESNHPLDTLDVSQHHSTYAKFSKTSPSSLSTSTNITNLQSVGTLAAIQAAPSQRCDAECSRLRLLVSSWPADKPRAAIVMLVRRKSLKVFGRSFRYFDENFNSAPDRRYPIIIFHEGELDDEVSRNQFRQAEVWTGNNTAMTSPPSPTTSLLFFQAVHFEIPSFINQSLVPKVMCFKGVGYRHMCRFQAKLVYEQPILEGLQYVWRLDDDSFIYRPVKYDIFRFMRERGIKYGYAKPVSDYRPCILGLWAAVDAYMKERKLKMKFRWPRGLIYWNNFEVSDLSVWRSAEYKDYMDYIDRMGGIYYKRWGDATIKTIAVTLFLPKAATHRFMDIAYKHGKHVKI